VIFHVHSTAKEHAVDSRIEYIFSLVGAEFDAGGISKRSTSVRSWRTEMTSCRVSLIVAAGLFDARLTTTGIKGRH